MDHRGVLHTIVCLRCLTARDVVGKATGACVCGYVGWSTFGALVRDPAYVTTGRPDHVYHGSAA